MIAFKAPATSAFTEIWKPGGLWVSTFATILLAILGGCKPASNDVRSEIGSNGELPPARVYPDEKIAITLWEPSGTDRDQISIEIEPDRSLYLRKYNVRRLEDSSRLDTETLDAVRLSERQFDSLRRRLSVYRPVELHSSGPSIFPRNCGLIMHGWAVLNVSFTDQEDRSGRFILQEGCEGPSVELIEKDLKQILSELPELRGMAGYGWRAN